MYIHECVHVVNNRMDAVAVPDNWSDIESEESDMSSDESEGERERTAIIKVMMTDTLGKKQQVFK